MSKMLLAVSLAVAIGLAAPHANAQSDPQPPARPRIGLALGGGSAKGLAHIGVLKWFDEHRIPVDVVSGTSMGGLIGGAFASGLSPAEIAAQMRSTNWDTMFVADSPFADKTFRRREDKRAFPSQLEFGLKHGFRLPNGLNPGQQVQLMLDEMTLAYYDIDSFDDLPTPFRCVATDLKTAEVVVLGSGRLATAMRATMSLPGMFSPVALGDRLLVDGGTLNNVPADVTRKMGAAVVIAVDVGTETVEERNALPSMFSLLGKTIDTMMRAWTRKALESATLVIYPNLDGFDSLSWRRSDDLAVRGYEAAERMKDDLLKYAVSEDEYRAFAAARQARRRVALPVIRSIEVRGVSPGEQELIRRELRANIGRQVDARTVAEDLLRITGTDRYECLSYRVAIGPDGPGLLVDAQPKSYGPPFLAFSMNASNIGATNFAMDFTGRLTMYDAVGKGSEVRVDGIVGSHLLGAVELYKPIAGSPLFVAPRFSTARTPLSLFVGDQWVGEYRVSRAGVGADVGLRLGRRAEARLGYDVAWVTGRVKVGSPELPEAEGTERSATASVTFDGQDSPTVPSRGVYASAVARRYFSVPDVVMRSASDALRLEAFTQAEAGVSAFHRAVGQDRVFTLVRGGTSFGDDPLIYDFGLGGPFRMGAYSSGQLRGPNYLYAAGGYLKRFARLPDIAGGNFYFGAWLEGGSVFMKLDSAEWHANVSAGAILETMLGPVFLGGGIGFDGKTRFYIAMGPTFR